MKNSKEYSTKLKAFYRSLKRKYPKVAKVFYDEPIDSLIHAIISENLTEKESQAVMKRFKETFIDRNDLRVSLAKEVVETIGADTPQIRNTALMLTQMLNTIFNNFNTLSLVSFKKIGKRPAKQALEKIAGVSHFAVNYCMLTAFGGHAIPLNEKMLGYLKANDLVDPQASQEDIEGFLARQISANNSFEFYYFLCRESECPVTVKPEKKIKKPASKKEK